MIIYLYEFQFPVQDNMNLKKKGKRERVREREMGENVFLYKLHGNDSILIFPPLLPH